MIVQFIHEIINMLNIIEQIQKSEKTMSEDFDEDLDDLEEEEPVAEKTPAIVSKTPAAKPAPGGEELSLFFQSTIGPGEKKQKLLVNTGNEVSAIKTTVGNIFGLNPSDFHLTQGGVTMEESKYMKDYNLKDGDTLLLIPASTAGRY